MDRVYEDLEVTIEEAFYLRYIIYFSSRNGTYRCDNGDLFARTNGLISIIKLTRKVFIDLESIYKRPPTGFKHFLHTHTSGHDKITFINEKSKTIHDNVLLLRQKREGNQASTESQVDETTLYIEAASDAKKRNLYGAGSKRVDYIKVIDSGNETTGITKVNDGENTDGGEMLIKEPILVTPEQVKDRKMAMIAA
ncbi:PDR ABC-type transporter family protein [Tanacetum coccineum]